MGRSAAAHAAARAQRSLRVWPLVIFGIFFAWYYFSHQEEVPLTGRSQLIDLSREQEAALGLESYRQILGQSQIVSSGPEVDTIREIGRRLAAVSDDPGFEWEFNLIASDQANAFALPGGKVAVYAGLLPITQNHDGLAAVMGHEIAHAIARHGAERIAHEKLAQLGTLAVGTAVGEMDIQTQRMVMAALGVGTQFGVLLPFSRSHESEADYMGLIFAARACFDPQEAPRLWERMAQAGGGARAGGVHVDASRPRDAHPEPEPVDAGGASRARGVLRRCSRATPQAVQ